MVVDEEALERHAFDQDGAQQARCPVGAGRRRGKVVVGDQPAHRDARADVEPGHDGVQHGAADILEVDVDAVRTDGLERRRQLRITVVQAGVEAQLVHGIATLVRRSGDADGACALEPGDLSYDRADGTGRGGDHDRVAGPHPSDVQKAGVGREARHAEHAQRIGRVRHGRVQTTQRSAIDDGIVLPAGRGNDQVALGEIRVARRNDAADRLAAHGRTDLHRRDVGRAFVHPATHVGVERQPHRADQHLPFGRNRHRRFFQPEGVGRRCAVRTTGEDDAAIAVGRLGHGAGSSDGSGAGRKGRALGTITVVQAPPL